MLEGPTFSFFWVENGAIYAPPLAEGILDSITRRRVLTANDVVEEHCPIDRLQAAPTRRSRPAPAIEVAPVLAIEGVREWDEPGPVTLAAHRRDARADRAASCEADRRALAVSSGA